MFVCKAHPSAGKVQHDEASEAAAVAQRLPPRRHAPSLVLQISKPPAAKIFCAMTIIRIKKTYSSTITSRRVGRTEILRKVIKYSELMRAAVKLGFKRQFWVADLHRVELEMLELVLLLLFFFIFFFFCNMSSTAFIHFFLGRNTCWWCKRASGSRMR